MEYRIFQWLVPLIGVFFISRTIYQYLHNKRSASSTLIWFVFWIAVMLLAVMPDVVTNKLAKILGFASNITAIIFVAIGLLFIFVFYLSSTIEKLETQMTELVRQLALEEAEKNRLKEKYEGKGRKAKRKRKSNAPRP